MITIEDLSQTQLTELFERTLHPTTAANRSRRKEFTARWLAMHERSDRLVRERIAETFHTPEVASEVMRWATSIFNPIRRLSELGAKAYSTPPIRHVVGISDDDNRQFLRTLKGLKFNAKAKSWNQWQIASNTIVVLVRPRRRANGDPTMDFIRVTGAAGEIFPHPEAPLGDPPAVLSYLLSPSGDANDIEHTQDEVVAMVDARWWSFFNRQGQLVRTVEHNVGRFPGAVLQVTEQDGESIDDFWNPDFGRATTEALRESGLISAIMGWARKSGFGKLIALLNDSDDKANEDDGEEGQTLGQPETLLELTGQDLVVEDIEVQITEFREHMGLVLAEAARGMTGTASILDEPRGGLSRSDTADVHRHAALRQYQQDQIVYLGPFEQDLQEVMAATARGIGMRGFPSPEAIADGYETKFVPLLFLDTPIELLNVAIAGTKFGTTNQVEFLMQQEGIGRAEATTKLLRLAEETARLNEFRASRQDPADPTDVVDDDTQEIRPELAGEGASEAQGRRGGRASPQSAA